MEKKSLFAKLMKELEKIPTEELKLRIEIMQLALKSREGKSEA